MRSKVLLFVVLSTICGIVYSCQNETEREFAQYKSAGKDLYQIHCKTCHGENGEGLGLLAPPLTDTVFLKNNKADLACIIKNGTAKPMNIHGKIYQEKMPAFKQLADIEIAKIIVYITNSYGNNQGMYKYQKVQEDLKNCEL